MALSWEDIVKQSGGDMVGGQLIVYANGKHTLLGVKVGNQFNLTAEGEVFVAKAEAGSARKKPVAKTAVAETEDDLDRLIAGVDLTLNLSDSAKPAATMGIPLPPGV